MSITYTSLAKPVQLTTLTPATLRGYFLSIKIAKISLQSLKNRVKYYVSDLAGWFNISARLVNNNKEKTKNG
jgi:hypothetical protein